MRTPGRQVVSPSSMHHTPSNIRRGKQKLEKNSKVTYIPWLSDDNGFKKIIIRIETESLPEAVSFSVVFSI